MRLLLPFVLLLGACAQDPAPPAEPSTPGSASPTAPVVDDTVVGIVATNGQLTTFSRAVEAAGLGETLRDADAAFTVFAPSDAAFAAMPDADREALLADEARLRALLLGHVVSTRMLTPDVIDGLTIETLGGTELTLTSDGTTVRVQDGAGTTATVTTADLDTSNGVVHVLDAVLSP